MPGGSGEGGSRSGSGSDSSGATAKPIQPPVSNLAEVDENKIIHKQAEKLQKFAQKKRRKGMSKEEIEELIIKHRGDPGKRILQKKSGKKFFKKNKGRKESCKDQVICYECKEPERIQSNCPKLKKGRKATQRR